MIPINNSAAPGGRCRRAALLALLGTVLLTAAGAQAQRRGRVQRRGQWSVGKVSQVTIEHLYVSLGQREGLAPGEVIEVQLPDRRWLKVKLVAVGSESAAGDLPEGGPWPRVGAPARARWRAAPERRRPPRVALRPPTPPLDWGRVDTSRPTLIAYRPPLDRAAAVAGAPPSRARAVFRLEYLGLLNLGAEEPRDYHQLGLSSDLDLPRLGVDWLDYSHRARFRLHLAHDLEARPFQRSRPLPLVYRARIGLQRGGVRGELGRLLGGPLPEATLIDGAMIRYQLAPAVAIGGFGGLLPHPDDLRPTAEASHFGAYSSLRLSPARGGGAWLLAADVGFIGSTWEGVVDRKALSAAVGLELQQLSLRGRAAVDFWGEAHPATGQPIDRPAVDLTTFGVAADLRLARWRAGASFDRYRFPLTRESLARFGDSFVSASQEPLQALAGYTEVALGRRWGIGTQGGWERLAGEDAGWAELSLRLAPLLRIGDRLRLSALTGQGLLRSYLGRLAYLVPVSEWLTVTSSYGLARDAYSEQQVDALWRQEVAAGLELLLGQHWLLTAEGRALLSDEEQLLQLLGTATYSVW